MEEPKFNDYIESLPVLSRGLSRRAWELLPPDLRNDLDLTLNFFHKLSQSNPQAMRELLELLKRQAGPAFQPLSRIAVVGPVNVGKSTLFNALVNQAGQQAEVSPLPGTTVQAQECQAGVLTLVDTPGLDNSQASGDQEQERALKETERADFLLLLFDATRGITKSDSQLYQSLQKLGKPSLVALNKMDLIAPKLRSQVLNSAALALGLTPAQVRPLSAQEGEGLGQLLLQVAVVEPRLLGELGQTLKPLRRRLAWQAIRRASVISCAVSLTPLPIIDFIPLTMAQVTMVLTLARIYAVPMTYARASELLTTFGLGLLARNLVSQLTKLGGPPGWTVSAAVATTCTVLIGYSCQMWFESGCKPSIQSLRALSQAISEAVLALIKSIGRRRQDRQRLDKAVEEAVERVTRRLEASEAPDLPIESVNSIPAQG